jgi:murein tripeptide amidase MpaA
LAEAYPDLAKLSSIGTSSRGRDVWLIEITNSATGPAEHKPGFYIDAHIHAEEHTTSAVALYAAWYLLTRYGSDEEVTRLLDQQVFYILPRLNPDGAELSLQPPYQRWVGNGRYLPGEDLDSGVIPQDLNGDGYIVHMRVPDPLGEWKVSSRDARLLVQRQPGEEGGQYYRLYPEGLIRDFDGVEVTLQKPRDGNLNRNFPAGWAPEVEQYGAGELPLSEPETSALARFILDHPNIAGMCSYHTHGGVILRPSMTAPDSDMSPKDLALYKDLGAVGTELTGYPTISIYEEFTPDKSAPRRGGLMDWTYEQMGIISFGPELWDIERTAGVDKASFYNLYPRDEETAYRVLSWVLEHCGEQGFRDWQTFDHPQLGRVEIGGMVDIWTYRNPPLHLLESLCHDNVRFNLRHAAAAPRVRVDSVETEALGAGLYKVRAVVANHGYLPTNLSDVAIQKGVAVPVTAELEPDGAELVMNPAKVELGHLAGRNERQYPWSQFGQQWTATKKAVEWLVRASDSQKASLRVVAVSQRAGRHERTIILSAEDEAHPS